MRIIAGLGNPGESYRHTRHNAGFETIDKMSYDHNIPLRRHRKFRAFIGEGRIGKTLVLLVKPQTYMNLSGESVNNILRFYKLPPSELIVIYDDASLPVGDVRVRGKGSAGGHKGMDSIISTISTDEFPRIRIGIGEKPEGWDLADYVLSRLKKDEWQAMTDGITKAGDALALLLSEGVPAAMNRYNKRNPRKIDLADTAGPEADA